MNLFRKTNPERLSKAIEHCNGSGPVKDPESPEIIGDVFIHHTAKVDPTAVVSVPISAYDRV